jgi:hypothetical protein
MRTMRYGCSTLLLLAAAFASSVDALGVKDTYAEGLLFYASSAALSPDNRSSYAPFVVFSR